MAGNVDTRVEIIPATGVVKLANANFLFVISASASATFQMQRTGLRKGVAQENYTGITAGLQIARTQPWDFCSLSGTPGTTVTFMYGNVSVREDVTLFNQQIAVISGVTAVATQPNTTLTDIAPKVTVVATQAAVVAQNLLRRNVTLFSDPRNVGDSFIFLRKSGGAQDIGILQPGTLLSFPGTYGIDYRAVGGGDTIYILEES